MKTNLFVLMIVLALLIVPIALAVDVTRTISGTTLTYTLTGFSGIYGVLIEDTITGGCTLSDGTTRFVGIMMNPETTKSLTFTKPASGTCTFTGTWDFGTTQSGILAAQTITIGGCTPVAETCGACVGTSKSCTDGCNTYNVACSSGCTNGATQSCTVGTCAGTQTCVSQAWGGCVKTVATCGGGTTTDLCGMTNFAASIFPDCATRLAVLGIGVVVILLLIFKK